MGEDLRPLPLSERRRRLAALLHGASPCLHVVEAFEGPIRVLAAVHKQGLEGIVSRIDAPYRSRPRSGWIKVETAGWREANHGSADPQQAYDADQASAAKRTLASSRAQALVRKGVLSPRSDVSPSASTWNLEPHNCVERKKLD